MMSLAYVRHSLKAAGHMAMFKTNTIGEFDVSYEGFFRSFAAMLIAAPLYPLIVIGERMIVIQATAIEQGARLMGIQGLTLAYCLIEAGSYVASWLLFPLVMVFIAKLIGAGARYVPFIVAYNWGTCIVLAVTAAMHLLHLAGIATLQTTAFLYYPVVGFALAYRWWIARQALEVPGWTAAGVVILDVLLSVFLAFAVGSIHQAVGGL
jgi:hypothetical protein